MKLNTLLCQLLPILLPTVPLFAQSFPGQYAARVSSGEAILEFQPAGSGAVRGTLTLPNSGTLQLTGSYQGANLSGVARAGSESERFAARLSGQQLVLSVGNIELPFERLQPAYVPANPMNVAQRSNEVNDPALSFRFTPPAGFSARPDGVWYLLTSPQTATRILVMRHNAASFVEIRKLAAEPFTYGKAFNLSPTSGVQVLNTAALSVDLAGSIEGRPGRARMIALQSPYGGGAVVLAGGFNNATAEFAALTEAVAQTIQFQKPQIAAASTTAASAVPAATSGSGSQFWTSRLAGKKLHYFSTYSSGYGSGSGYAEHKQMSLCSDGSFYFNGQFSGSINVPGATAGMGRNNGNGGHWSLNQSMLVLTFGNGSQTSYNLVDQGGKTLLNGKRWLVEDSKECR